MVSENYLRKYITIANDEYMVRIINKHQPAMSKATKSVTVSSCASAYTISERPS